MADLDPSEVGREQEVPTSEDHARTCWHYITFGDGECDCKEVADCPVCAGTACEEECGRLGPCQYANAGPDSHRICRYCRGRGVIDNPTDTDEGQK